MQAYLLSDKITVKEAKMLFKIRTRMLDVKRNYKNKYLSKNRSDYESLLCEICKGHEDNTENIFLCPELSNTGENKFDDLFSRNIDKMLNALKQFQKLWIIREDKLKQMIPTR